MYYIELCVPQSVLIEELRIKGITQRSIAITYAFIIKQEPDSDFSIINKAITEKFGIKGLMRIRNKAWKLIREQN